MADAADASAESDSDSADLPDALAESESLQRWTAALVDATAAHDEETSGLAGALSQRLAAILSRGFSELALQSEAEGDRAALRRCLSSMSTSSIGIGVAAASAESEGDSDVSGASSACDSEELEIQVAMSLQTTPAAPPAAADEGDYKVPRDWTAALVDATAAHDEETCGQAEALSQGLAVQGLE